uniref:Uncharacterized protein n=1 Tax=Ixodes ricinus TaxID=34613 RepID=A0A6B0U1P7_IXORI
MRVRTQNGSLAYFISSSLLSPTNTDSTPWISIFASPLRSLPSALLLVKVILAASVAVTSFSLAASSPSATASSTVAWGAL